MREKSERKAKESENERNVRLVQKYGFSKYAIDDEIMNSPLTEREKQAIEKAFT
jgi:hypothetical protein